MGFNTEMTSYPSANGTDMVSAKLFLPTHTDIRAIVQISHGMCEHMGRYEDFARYLCEQGFMVCGNDHIGHRYSVKSKGDLGFFSPHDGWKDLVQDVYTLTCLVRERYPATPYFLLGHSMGSFIARCYLGKYGAGLSGAVISGTGGPNPMTAAGEHLADMLCKTQGHRKRSKMLDAMFFGKYNDRFEGRTSKDWLTRDRDAVDAYLADSYCNFRFTNAAFRDLAVLVGLANNGSWAGSIPKNLPILLVSGDQDPVGDYGKGVRRVSQMLRDAGVRDVTLHLYHDGRHEMLNELNRGQVYEEIYRWISDRAGQPPEDAYQESLM